MHFIAREVQSFNTLLYIQYCNNSRFYHKWCINNNSSAIELSNIVQSPRVPVIVAGQLA
jgi:hypothetical protein